MKVCCVLANMQGKQLEEVSETQDTVNWHSEEEWVTNAFFDSKYLR